MDTWITTNRKRKRVSRDRIEVTREIVQKHLPSIVGRYKPRSVFLFGSMARKTQNMESDIDIIFIWNTKLPEEILYIAKEISFFFGKKIDMVNMIYIGRLINDDNNSLFLDNVYDDAFPIYGNIDPFDIKLSYMQGKINL